MSIYVAVHFLGDLIYNHPNISVALSLSSLLLWLAVRRPSDIPPNPWFIFPIIGHRPLLRGDPIQTLRRLRTELGEVFSVYIDAQLVIVVNGLAAIKEAFDIRGMEFHWRPNTRTCDLFHFGVICNSGKEWREQRSVTDEGMQHVNPRANTLTRKETSHLVSAIKEKAGEAFDPRVLLQSAVFNALTSVVFSRRMDYKDARMESVTTRFKENLELFSDSKYPNFFPFQKFLMGDFFDVKYLRINMAEIHQKVISPIFEEHRAEFNESKVVDVLDVYLKEMKNNEGKEGTTIEEKSCQAVVYDLLWHGTTVTSATLEWAILFLLQNPTVQQDVQKVLDNILSKADAASDGDIVQGRKLVDMPISFQAFLKEVQRCANVCPLSMAHGVAREKFLKGYRIPGDAVILPNLDSLMMDKDVWGDPEVFRPERFINSDGKLSVPTEFIPFFVGQRNCPGAHVAQMILINFLSFLLYNFDLKTETDDKFPSGVRQKGLVPLPPSFKVRFVPRR